MSLSPGTRLGSHEILAPLGAGGMGEVYRARDTRLDREEAVKILPEVLARDPERLARFEREAKVLAALNHPNIAQIYGVEERALVMELVQGERLPRPVPLETALNYARQIADALESAHEKGVVHRDLKPANIMVTPAGVVKVLDFGLAAVLQGPARTSGDPTNSPTLTMQATAAGVIMGTAAYMSPEQAAGKPVDRRADIWSFGVVLFEMLTGHRLFEGETTSHTMAGVMKDPIDFSRLPAETPAPIRDLLARCLDRDVKNRLRDIGEARIAIAKYQANPKGVTEAPRQTKGSPKWALAVAAVFALAALALGYIAFRHFREEPPQALRFLVPPPPKGEFSGNGVPAVSPDGRHVAYVARVEGRNELWVRDLDTFTSRRLVQENSRFPFWSPDSRAIGFFTASKLKRIDVAGGAALTLCDVANGSGGSWSQAGVILFAPIGGVNTGLFKVEAGGGNPVPVTRLDKASGETVHLHPWFLPDSRHFLYTASTTDDDKVAIYLDDLNSPGRRRLMFANSNAAYVAPGFLLFMRERTLMAQPFDARKLQSTADAFPIAEQVDTQTARTLGEFSASQNGVLAYASGVLNQNVQLTWFDRSGKPMGTVGGPADIEWPSISPDGKTVALDRRDLETGHYDLWLRDLARGTESKFTFNSKDNAFPVWSPDGSYLAFLSSRDGGQHVYRKATNGVGQEEAVDKDDLVKRPTDWSADGRFLLEESGGGTPKTSDDIWVAPMSGEGSAHKPYPYLQTEFAEGMARLSPNGKWLAYRSNETKRNEIYLMTFPTPGGKWQISTDGGNIPVWSRDGKELFFISGDNKMMVVEIKGTGSSPEAGVPEALFDVRLGPNNPRFDVSKDGRFLVGVPVDQAAGAPINVVVNWTAGMKK